MAVLVAAALVLLRGVLCGVDVYAAFLRGAERGMKAAASLLPALCAMLLMLSVAEASGFTQLLSTACTPLLRLLRLPQECAPVFLLRPLTGSGSLSALRQVFERCGADSRAGVIASVLVGSSETIFYTLTVYLAGAGVKRLPWVVPVSLAAYLAGCAAAGMLL